MVKLWVLVIVVWVILVKWLKVRVNEFSVGFGCCLGCLVRQRLLGAALGD